MKKFICLILFLLSFSVNVSFAKNDACTSGSKLLVLQVLDDGVLGYICPRVNWDYSDFKTACRLDGKLVFLSPDYNYVDDQLIKLSRKECFAEVGTYRYINKKDYRKTVRAVEIIRK